MITLNQVQITAFGGLKDHVVAFTPGLNVKRGDNESGKSTTLAFLRWMFYGFASPADKKLNRPLDGDIPQGSITLTRDGETYKITRRSPNTGKDRIQILRLADSAVVGEGSEPGEYFFSLPGEMFDRTAVIRQGDGSVWDAKKLSGAMSNLLSSADETISVEKAIERLESVRISLLHRNKKGGQIAESEAVLTDLRARLKQAKERSRRASELEGQIEQKKKTLSSHQENSALFERQLLAYQIQKRKEKEELLARLLQEMVLARRALKEAEEGGLPSGFVPTEAWKEEYRRAKDAVLTTEEALRSAQTRLFAAGAVKTDETKERFARHGGAQATIDAVSAHLKKSKTYRLIGFLTLIFLVGIIFLLLSGKEKKKADAILAEFSCSSLSELEETAKQALAGARKRDETIAACQKAVTEAQTDLDSAREDLLFITSRTGSAPEQLPELLLAYDEQLGRLRVNVREASAAYSSTKALLDGETPPQTPDFDLPELPENFDSARATQSYRFYAMQIPALEKQIHQFQVDLAELRAVSEDPSTLSDQIGEEMTKLRKMKEEHSSLELAIEKLTEASGSMRDNVTGNLARIAASYLSRMTQGRFSTLSVNSGFDIDAPHPDWNMAVDPAYLSEGTRNQTYLALRLALSRLICRDQLPPLLLDEALVYLDDKRLGQVLDLLAEEERQVILFTASGRENALLEQMK